MLVTLKEILSIAESKNCAIGSFNTPGLTFVRGILRAAEELQMPVILSHAQVHEPIIPLDLIGPIMVRAAQRSSVPVCVHLDHGEDLAYLQRALELGFTSIMYDGSNLPFEENVSNTQKTVAMATHSGASVEAEFGSMGQREDGSGDLKQIYTDPRQAKLFCDLTSIDALACSFGTVHGIYTSEPKLDFERVAEIRHITGKPLVMHGGSGVCEADFRKVIACGVRKINYFTYMAKAGAEATKEKMATTSGTILSTDIEAWIQAGITADVKKALSVFSENAK